MAETHQTQFDTYRVYYVAGGGETPTIDCFFRGEHVGTLVFHADDGPAASNEVVRDADGAVVLRIAYRLSQFSDLIDLLREEKPLYLRLSEESLAGGVMTGQEPVGEGEPYLSR